MFYLNKILYFFLILFLLIGILGFFINSNPSNQIIKKPYLPFLEKGLYLFPQTFFENNQSVLIYESQ
ncbi:hypothetical protein NEU07_000417, partial [Campylobacter jejuni]|nr:hypothetical protein [Campylobacter jejuni]